MQVLRAAVALVLSFVPAVGTLAADCVQLDASGRLTSTGETAENCSAYLLITGADYNELFAVSSLFDTTPEQIQQAFIAGFSLPVICYLVAWAYQAVISFISND